MNKTFNRVGSEQRNDGLVTTSESVLAFPHSHPWAWVPADASREFIAICRSGDLSRAKQFLQIDPRLVNATDYDVRHGHGAMIVHAGDGIYCMNAVQASVLAGKNEIVSLLVSSGARVPADSILSAASSGNVVALKAMLPSFKIQVEQRELNPIDDFTHALISACRSGHRAAAALLLESGALIDGTTGYYRSGGSLEAAMMSSNTDLVSDLLGRGANVNARMVRLSEGFRDVNQEAVALVRAKRSHTTPSPHIG